MSGLSQKRTETARHWLFEQALPFWARIGRHERWGFHERLDLSAVPLKDSHTRVRVQARQTYCFACAATLGWQPDTAYALIRHGVEALLTRCRQRNGLYGQRVDFVAGPAEKTSDLYDCAFVLLALCRAAHALQDSRIEAEAEALGAQIDEQFSHISGGYHAFLPPTEVRLQNPHMHLLEASLAHAQLTGNKASMRRSAEIIKFTQAHFCDAQGRLHEEVNPDRTLHTEDHFEAGHQFEWVWLLSQWEKLSGECVQESLQSLYAFGQELTAPDGRLALSHHPDTRCVREPVCRCWSQTEALKAHLVRMEQGDPNALLCAISSFDRLWADHIIPAPEGAWIDRVSVAGEPLSTDIPASSFYHVFLALAEWMRVADAL